MASTLGTLNPLRYRGYVYDNETGLYYLQSRYYNPTWGRFLTADSYISTGQGLLGHNMFAYCRNNPVCRKDISGTIDADCYDNGPVDQEDILKLEDGGGGNAGSNHSLASTYSSSPAFNSGYTGGKGSSTSTQGSKSTISGNTNSTNLPSNGTTVSSSTALDMAIDYLGPGYTEASPGRFVSADGVRQVRMKAPDLLGSHAGGAHINFDLLSPRYKSVHIFFYND